jgi:hypothetical protein
MKNIGLVGAAVATRFTGEVTVAFGAGLVTVNGKSVAPLHGGRVVPAGGAGMFGSADGDQVIVTGGVVG